MRRPEFLTRENIAVEGVPNQVTDQNYRSLLTPGTRIQSYYILGGKVRTLGEPITLTIGIDGEYIVGQDPDGEVVLKLHDVGLAPLPDSDQFNGIYAIGLVTG